MITQALHCPCVTVSISSGMVRHLRVNNAIDAVSRFVRGEHLSLITLILVSASEATDSRYDPQW